MDCSNRQGNACLQRPHMQMPACGNTACGNQGSMRPIRPVSQDIPMPIAMAYVPWQQWCQTYSLEQGFSRGTIFPELDLPFVMGRCR